MADQEHQFIRGRVIEKDDSKVYPQCQVIITYATPKNAYNIKRVNTDNEGNFSLYVSNNDLYPAETKFTIKAFDAHATLEKPVTGKKEELVKRKQVLYMIDRKKINLKTGKWVFGTFCLLGLLFIVAYIWLHKQYKEPKFDFNTVLITSLQSHLDTLIVPDSLMHPDSIKKYKPLKNQYLLGTIATLKSQINEHVTTGDMDSTFFMVRLSPIFASIDSAIEIANKPLMLARLDQLKESAGKKPTYFWTESPKKWAEILLWAFFATLIRFILTIGYYLYKGIYRPAQRWNDIGLLIAVPVIALLISFVISFIKIRFEVGSANLTLDLTHPELAIVFAVLIGLSPWDGWRFLQDLSDTFFKWLNKVFTGGGNGQNGDGPDNSNANG